MTREVWNMILVDSCGEEQEDTHIEQIDLLREEAIFTWPEDIATQCG